MSVAESVSDPVSYYRVNVGEGLVLLEQMVRRGVRRIVFSSTCAVYGVPVSTPIAEDHPQDPISPYGASKRAVERALLDISRAGALRAIALRYFNAAGCDPGGRLGEDHRPEEHIVPLAVDAALGRGPGLTIFGDDYDTPDGTCIRDYIHVNDLAEAHIRSMDLLGSQRVIELNLGTGRGFSVKEIIRAAEAVTGSKVPVDYGPRRPGDAIALYADASAARKTLGWEARYREPEQIIATAWNWFQQHPDGYGD